VWQRRQEIPPQQTITEPTLMEGVERTNVMILCPQQREGVVQRNPYTMKVNRGRNYYTCRRFRHIA